MFWGLSMEPQKRYSQTVTESFHVSQAALDCSTLNNESGPTQLIIDFNENSYLLASLCKKDRIYQVPLDLNFERGDVISFRTVGPGVIHMSGYHIIEEDENDLARRLMGEDSDGEEVEDESEEDEDESTDESMVQTGKRKKQLALMGKSKKKKLDEASSDDEDDDEDDDADDSIDSTLGDSTLAALAEEDSDEEDDDDEDDVEEEEEEDDESDASELDSDEEVEQVPKKNNVVVNGTGTPKSAKKEKTKTPKSEKKSNNEQNQLNKTPKQDKTPKKEGKTPKGAETPKLDKGTPKPEKTPNAASPNKRVIEGGVIVEDLKQGNGPVAKEGKMLQMYYVGRLKSNNKQFDATTAGPGFKFRLGKGEVIKGWDVGIQGMKVGGKRRLTVPAPMAYGKQGSPPVIPSNATLTFDVELRRVS